MALFTGPTKGLLLVPRLLGNFCEAVLGISRPTFYQNIQPHIPEYKQGALRRIYYRQSDLDAFKGIRKIDSDEEKR